MQETEKQNIHNLIRDGSGELANKMYPTMCKKKKRTSAHSEGQKLNQNKN
jgi:hypothetical protein